MKQETVPANGGKIRELRDANHWSRQELARGGPDVPDKDDNYFCSAKVLENIEKSSPQRPTNHQRRIIEDIADALGVPPDELILKPEAALGAGSNSNQAGTIKTRHDVKYFRYVSASKVRMLYEQVPPPEGASESSGLVARLRTVLHSLAQQNLVREFGGEKAPFVSGSLPFVECFMKGVVLWIATTNDWVLLLGGSGRYLNFDRFTREEIPHLIPGSNPTGIVNALTTLWRVLRSDDGTICDDLDPEWIATTESLHSGDAKCDVTDDIVYQNTAVPFPKWIYNNAKRASYYYSHNSIELLEFTAKVFIDVVLDGPWNKVDYTGKRLVVGSPIYVAEPL